MSFELSSESQSARILIVDDEDFVREAFELYFSTEGFQTFTASGGEMALDLLQEQSVDIAILDILMPGMDGIQLLREIKKRFPDVEVVMVSGCGTIESAIESLRLGAYDYVTKPILNFDEDLLKVVRKALERRGLLTTNRKLSIDLKEINRELKDANARMRRHLAELEVLYDTGRMMVDLDDFDCIVDLTLQTLDHQFQITHSMLLMESGDGWRIQGTSGFPVKPDHSSIVSLEDTVPDPKQVSDGIQGFDPMRSKLIEALFGAEPVPEVQRAYAVPLHCKGTNQGLLIVLPEATWSHAEDRLRLLRLLADQVSSAIALGRKEPA